MFQKNVFVLQNIHKEDSKIMERQKNVFCKRKSMCKKKIKEELTEYFIRI